MCGRSVAVKIELGELANNSNSGVHCDGGSMLSSNHRASLRQSL